ARRSLRWACLAGGSPGTSASRSGFKPSAMAGQRPTASSGRSGCGNTQNESDAMQGGVDEGRRRRPTRLGFPTRTRPTAPRSAPALSCDGGRGRSRSLVDARGGSRGLEVLGVGREEEAGAERGARRLVEPRHVVGVGRVQGGERRRVEGSGRPEERAE